MCPPSLFFLALSPFKANFVLPESGDFLDQVTFVELQRDEAEKLVKQYNEEGRRAAPPPEKRFDNRQTGYHGQSSSFQRYDNRGGPRGGYQNRGSSGGGYRPGPYSFSANQYCIKYSFKQVLCSTSRVPLTWIYKTLNASVHNCLVESYLNLTIMDIMYHQNE